MFAGQAAGFKAKGSEFEKQNYLLASDLAEQNAKFTETSTAIKQAQLTRQQYQATGGVEAEVAGAGFAESGSALDILRESAQQGAITHAVADEQGLITEAGYKEQAQSYQNMASAAQVAIDADKAAQEGSTITGIIKGVAGIASLFTGLPISSVVDGFVPQAPSDPSNPLRINQYAPAEPSPGSSLSGLY